MYDSYKYIINNEGIDTAKSYGYVAQVSIKQVQSQSNMLRFKMSLHFFSKLTASTVSMVWELIYQALFRSRVAVKMIFSQLWPMLGLFPWLWMPVPQHSE